MSVKIAIIGAGWVCEDRHIPALKGMHDVEITGIVDPDEDRAQALAAKFNIKNVSCATDPKQISWLHQANAVSISTPPREHHAWMAACLDLGKDVLIEKPVALSRDEAADLDTRIHQSGAMVGVMHNNLFTRSAIRARDAIARGSLGRLTAIQIHLLNSPRRHLPDWYEGLPFGLLYDELSHFLYLSDSLGKNLQVCSATIVPSTHGKATPAHAALELESDTFPLSYSLNFESPICEWQMTMIGEKGILVHDIFRDILLRIPDDRKHQAIDHFRTMALATLHAWSGFIHSGLRHVSGRLDFGVSEVMKRFVGACETRQQPERIAWSDALRVFHLLQDSIEALSAASKK